jgi:hypothetical protein
MAVAARKLIPQATQASILAESRRRCALCFHLDGDLSVKTGQLAHIDRNRASAAESNLVFLCLEHHSQYDSIPSQHKGFMPQELAEAKRQLQRAIAEGRHLNNRATLATPQGREADRVMFTELVQMMTASRTADFLRRTCFGSQSFHWRQLNDIDDYIQFSDGAECEFIDSDLESLRQKFVAAYKRFRPLLAENTAPTAWNPPYRTVPVAWEETNPRRYARTVKMLRTAADEVCAAYDELVRAGRARFSP